MGAVAVNRCCIANIYSDGASPMNNYKHFRPPYCQERNLENMLSLQI